MADLDLSLVATFDGGEVAAGTKEIASGLDQATAAQARGTAANNEAAAAAQRAAKADAELTAAMLRAREASYGLGGGLNKTAVELRANAVASEAAALAATKLGAAQKSAATGVGLLGTSARQQRASFQNLGYQINDFSTQVLNGINPMVAFTQQSGQVAFAMQGLGGAAGKVGTFLAGPFGALVLVGVSVLGMMAGKLLDTDDAAKKAEKSTIDFSSSLTAQIGVVGSYTNAITQLEAATRSLINTQSLLIDNSKAFAESSAASLQAELTRVDQQIGARRIAPFTGLTDAIANRIELGKLQDERNKVNDLLNSANQSLSRAQTAGEARAANESANPKLKAQGEIDRERARLTERRLYTLNNPISAQAGTGQLELLTEGDFQKQMATLRRREDALTAPKGPKPKKAPDTDALVNRVKSDLSSVLGQFGDVPTFIQKADAETRKLDADIKELTKKKPPNFQILIDQATAAKKVIQDNIAKPFDDYVEAQTQSLAVSRLLVAGHEDQANALKVTFALQKSIGPLDDKQKATVLATVAAERKLNDQLAARKKLIGDYVSSIDQARSGVESLLSGTSTGADFLKSLKANFNQLRGKLLTESIFGKAFDDLKDFVEGRTGVHAAVDIMSTEAKRAGESAGNFANELDQAARKIVATMGDVTAAPTVTGASGKSVPWYLGAEGSTPAEPPDDSITVTGQKYRPRAIDLSAEEFFGKMSTALVVPFVAKLEASFGTSAFSRNLTRPLTGALEGYITAGPVGAALGAVKDLKFLPDSLQKTLGKAFGGSQTGAQIAQIGKAVGIKTSTLGGEIGGALGAASGIPGGEIIGSILGSVVGGLFKKTKTGTATLGSVDGVAGVSGSGGNNAAFIKSATSLGNTVTDGLNSIADALGADIGSFAVSIGQRNKKFVVDPSGGGKTKGGGTTKYATAEEAAAAALLDAIADGAITGLSAAVSAALRSSPDVDRAVKEALKVQNLETLLGGVAGSLNRVFSDFDREAADRVRLARKYGLDLNAVEKLNADERAKIVADTLQTRTGSLKTLLDDLNFGSLSEGDAYEKRAALKEQIAKAQADAANGKDGAADQLASLESQLVQFTRDNFGTAGGQYASDRADAITAATAIIQSETNRINAAAGQGAAQIDALNQNNTLTDETNNLLAIQNATLADILAASLASGTGPGSIDYGSAYRDATIQ